MPSNSQPNLDLHLLQSSGLTDPLPLPIRSVTNITKLTREEIKVNAGSTEKQGLMRKRTIKANDVTSSYCGLNDFELFIDNDFVAQKHNLIITNCSNFSIKASDELLKLNSTEKIFIGITHCRSFSVQGLKTIGGRNIITTSDSSNFTLSNCKSQNASGYGIITHNSTQFSIEDCRFHHNLSGIMVVGQSANGSIVNCTCKGSYGFFNCDAGIHLCATSPKVRLKQIPERCHEQLSIDKKTFRPQNILIKSCILSECRAQGIYLEGAVNCLIENNTIIDNNKEGICFDWGSCYNIFINNIISLNGERRNVSEEERRADFITKYPLLEDGSSSMKLPAISIDNGCMNLIDSNKIVGNYGGGIKMVRSAILNKINNNIIVSNTIGQNAFIPHFHGISALGVGAVNNEFNEDRNSLLAFLPSALNSMSNNIIHDHWNAIYMDTVSKNNALTDNDVEEKAASKKNPAVFLTRLIALMKRNAWCLIKKIQHTFSTDHPSNVE